MSIWCARRDLNPYVEDTRTSNVPVCQFQHSRITNVCNYTIGPSSCQYENTTPNQKNSKAVTSARLVWSAGFSADQHHHILIVNILFAIESKTKFLVEPNRHLVLWEYTEIDFSAPILSLQPFEQF